MSARSRLRSRKCSPRAKRTLWSNSAADGGGLLVRTRADVHGQHEVGAEPARGRGGQLLEDGAIHQEAPADRERLEDPGIAELARRAGARSPSPMITSGFPFRSNATAKKGIVSSEKPALPTSHSTIPPMRTPSTRERFTIERFQTTMRRTVPISHETRPRHPVPSSKESRPSNCSSIRATRSSSTIWKEQRGEGGGVGTKGVPASDNRAEARADDHVGDQPRLPERGQHPQVGDASRHPPPSTSAVLNGRPRSWRPCSIAGRVRSCLSHRRSSHAHPTPHGDRRWAPRSDGRRHPWSGHPPHSPPQRIGLTGPLYSSIRTGHPPRGASTTRAARRHEPPAGPRAGTV